MKLELSCNYFIRLLQNMKIHSHKFNNLLILILIGLFFSCGSDRKKQNEIKKEECLRLSYLAFQQNNQSSSFFSAEENQKLTYELSYSCSAQSGQSPSCIEYYYLNSIEQSQNSVCNSGYKKSSVICSNQNLIGSCFVFTESGYEKTIYANPNDSEQQSQLDCSLKNGKYLAQDNSNLLANLLISCELTQNNN